ncbi:hypothetical protein [Streptomyces bobili]
MRSNRIPDLIVFLAVLTVGTTLALHDVPPEPLAAIAVILTDLYAAWRGLRRTRSPQRESTRSD